MTSNNDDDLRVLVRYLAREHIEAPVRRRLRRSLEAVPSILEDDESPILMSDGFHAGFGLLVLTDRRALFLVEDEPLAPMVLADLTTQEVLARPSWDPSYTPSDLQLLVDGQSIHVEAVGDEVWVDELAEAIHDHAVRPAPRPVGDDQTPTLYTQCPFCDTPLEPPRLPDSPCPQCSLVLPGDDVPAPALPHEHIDGQRQPSGTERGPVLTEDGTTRCPYCAEEIRPEAIVCRHCRLALSDDAPQLAGTPTGRTNGLAIASLVLGLLWLYGLGSLLALIFGYAARGQIDRSRPTQGGRGLAIAGIVLGWIGLAVIALFVLFGIALVSEARNSAY